MCVEVLTVTVLSIMFYLLTADCRFVDHLDICSQVVHVMFVRSICMFFLGINYKTTTLLLDGKRIKLQLWYAVVAYCC